MSFLNFRTSQKTVNTFHDKVSNITTPPLKTTLITCRAFSHDVTAAMLVYQDNPVGVELFSYANVFFLFQ